MEYICETPRPFIHFNSFGNVSNTNTKTMNN